MDVIFLIGRILFGGFFLFNGLNHFMKREMLAGYAASKGVPLPAFSVFLSGLMLFLGGLGIVLGIYITLSVILLALFLLVASFKMHNFWQVEDPNQKMSEMTQFMKNMALLGASLMILMISSWPLSL